MHPAFCAVLALCVGVANAHFHLFYPEPRGLFHGPAEVNFCDGYTEVTTNRSTFPLSGGFFTIKQGHPDWALAVLISTAQNPNTLGAFNGSNGGFARQWAKGDVPGNFCVPLSLDNLNITGIRDGANVTIQVVISGGDGNLYQCADLTLSSNYTIPESINSTCVNTTVAATTESGAGTTLPQNIYRYAILFVFGGLALALS